MLDQKIGLHIYKGKKTFQNTFDKVNKKTEHDENSIINAVQIFVTTPRGYTEVKIDEGFIEEIHELDINLYVHSTYMAVPWNGTKKSIDATIRDINRSIEIGAKGIVIHLSKKPAKVIAKETFSLCKLFAGKIKILLEMKATKYDKGLTFQTAEDINELIKELESYDVSPDDVGICIDTAHIYAGKVDISTYKLAKKYLSSINSDWIGLIHLNGNQYNNNERSGDKHCIPFSSKDQIWHDISYKKSGCRAFIELCDENDVDFILEIKASMYKDINKFYSIITTDEK